MLTTAIPLPSSSLPSSFISPLPLSRPRSCPVKANRVPISANLHHSFTWSVAQSRKPTVLEAVTEAITRASPTLAHKRLPATVVFLFVPSTFPTSHQHDLRRVVSVSKKALAMRRVLAENTTIFGCTTAPYVTEDDNPSASVALVHFPDGTAVSTFRVASKTSFDLDWKQSQWCDFVGIPNPTAETTKAAQMNIVLLEHPDFDAMQDLLSGLDFAYPGVRKLGAAAGRSNPLHNAFLFDTNGHIENGVIGLAFASPDVQVNVTVAQGARGVGPLLEVMEVCDGNEITRVKEVNTPGATVGPPMVLLDMWGRVDSISQEDRDLARQYLLFGVEVQKVVDVAVSSITKEGTDENKNVSEAQQPIDMVIRKVVGFNEATMSLGVEGNDVRLGSRVQFQIRDEEAARAELTFLFNKLMLEGSSKAMQGMSLMGALLMADSERGENLYGNVVADLDREMYTERFPVPLAVLTSERQIGPLPSGGLLGAAGNTFTLSASALYVSFYGRTAPAADQRKNIGSPAGADSQ